MRIIGDTKIPFLSYRRISLTFSLILILAGVGYQQLGPGLNLGIDFLGGTQVTVKFREATDLTELRSFLAELGVGEPSVQAFDEVDKHEVLIRVQNPGGTEGDFTTPILDLLRSKYNPEIGDAFDINSDGSHELAARLAADDPEGIGIDPEVRAEHYRKVADSVLSYRKEQAIFFSLDELDNVEGIAEASRDYIKKNSALGEFSLLGAENVGPAVGADLRAKATYAIVFSLLGMLGYIWFRFQFPYAIGAVAALFHDVLITLSALAITGREVNLPTIAALLTLVGYSVNDTVVVFDRVRENLRLRRGDRLEDIMNGSINQTLSRTFITSGTTLAVVLTLYVFGGDVINTFAFVLLIGIVVGTYSSIFVASPVALYINSLLAANRKRKRAAKRHH